MIRRFPATSISAVIALMGAASNAFAQSTPNASKPAAGNNSPHKIDIAHAPAPLYDDPIWHGASDPTVVWLPGKGADGKGEYWMYYTQRRASMANKKGVDWVHGTAIGIATSSDGLDWNYLGVALGTVPMDGQQTELGDPIKSNVSWWAPAVFWDDGNGIAGGGKPGAKLHMFVTLVHGIFDRWTGDRTIEHLTSDDGVHWKHVSQLPLASRAVIDPTAYKIGDTWHLWYKNEAAGSRTFMATSKDLNEWKDMGDSHSGRSHEAPFVWKWKDAYWLIHDTGRGLDTWRSETGTGDWIANTMLLADNAGKRSLDKGPGHHPWLITQGEPGNEQLLIFYFVHNGDPTTIQLAEVSHGPDGKLICNRNKYLETTPTPSTTQAGN